MKQLILIFFISTLVFGGSYKNNPFLESLESYFPHKVEAILTVAEIDSCKPVDYMSITNEKVEILNDKYQDLLLAIESIYKLNNGNNSFYKKEFIKEYCSPDQQTHPSSKIGEEISLVTGLSNSSPDGVYPLSFTGNGCMFFASARKKNKIVSVNFVSKHCGVAQEKINGYLVDQNNLSGNFNLTKIGQKFKIILFPK